MQIQNNESYIYCTLTVEQVVEKLRTSLTSGLSESEARDRCKSYGLNELGVQRASWFSILIAQFTSPFVYLLLIIAAATFALQDFSNGVIICACILLNTAVGFYQEYKADKSLVLLKKYLVAKVFVLRAGKQEEIPSSQLVPGDILLLYPGDVIPADVRFAQTEHLSVDESLLTGESIEIPKSAETLPKVPENIFAAHNIGFSGTAVARGKGIGIVIATGVHGALGQINSLTAQIQKVSGFSEKINRFSNFICLLIFLIVALVFGIHLLFAFDRFEIINLAIFSIALGITIVPEALPVVTTFGFTRGALRLAQHEVVVKRLSAIEDLGSIEILCTDKTGTLTENKLQIASVYGPEREVLLWAALSAGMTERNLSVAKGFDSVIWQALSAQEQELVGQYEKVAEIPFDSNRRRSLVLLKHCHQHVLAVRGSAQDVLGICDGLDADQKASIEQWIGNQGENGNRVIAVATKETPQVDTQTIDLKTEEQGFNLVGLIAFEDPLKPTSRGAIVKAGKLGIQIKILSGDSPEVCAAIGKKVGLLQNSSQVITGDYFAQQNQEEKETLVENGIVFARVSPEQKYEIIQLLQKNYKVGYMGDGINDAPALKIAHVALAVDDAADIARNAADIILFKQSLSVIINGIEEGRIIFANTLKYIKITLAAGFGHFYALAVASLLIDFLPMLPSQLLVLNLLTDVPLIALSTDSMSMQEVRSPQKYDFKAIIIMATILGLVISTFDFIVFALFYHRSPAVLQTNWFISCILTETMFTLSTRSTLPFYKAKRPSKTLVASLACVVLLALVIPFTSFGQDWLHFVKPTGADILLIVMLSVGCFMATELMKFLYTTFYKGSGAS